MISDQMKEAVELATHRELRKHLDSHVGHLKNLTLWTALAVLGVLSIATGFGSWLALDKFENIVAKAEPEILGRIDVRVDAALESAEVEKTLLDRVKAAEEKVDIELGNAVRTAVEGKSEKIGELVSEYLKTDAGGKLFSRVKQDYGDLPMRIAEADKKFADLDAKLDKVEQQALARGQATILAVAIVSRGRLWQGDSSEGVSYSDGWVTFPNPDNMKFVPVIADFLNRHYATETQYVRALDPPNRFQVWKTPLDTSDRNSPPSDFTAVVIGIPRR